MGQRTARRGSADAQAVEVFAGFKKERSFPIYFIFAGARFDIAPH